MIALLEQAVALGALRPGVWFSEFDGSGSMT